MAHLELGMMRSASSAALLGEGWVWFLGLVREGLRWRVGLGRGWLRW